MSESPQPAFVWPDNILAPLRTQLSGHQDNDKEKHVPKVKAGIYTHPFRRAFSLKKEPWQEQTATIFSSRTASPRGKGMTGAQYAGTLPGARAL